MSCPDFSLSSFGRRGIGVVQPQSGLDYPFVAPTVDVRYLVADFFLSYDDPGEYDDAVAVFRPPFRIKYLYNVGCEDNDPPVGFPALRNGVDAEVVVVDANNNVVFDSTASNTEYQEEQWSANYKLYRWQTVDGTCELVAYTTWAATDDDKKTYAKYLAPINATLDPRATYKMPKRVRQISVNNGGTRTSGLKSNINFRNGYNTTLITAEPTVNNFRLSTAVLFNAVAGSGSGKYQNCTTDETGAAIQPVQQINGIQTANGDFLISGTDCVWARRPTTRDQAGGVNPSGVVHQQIGADCPPCCECSDYVDTALYMNQVQSQYMLIGSRVNDVKLYHEQNVARWQDQRTCSVNPLKLLLVPQRCPFMDVVIMLCNPCQDCILSSRLTLTLQPSITSPATLVCGYTAFYAAGINGRPIPISETQNANNSEFSAQFPIIRGGGSAYLKFRVKFTARSQYVIDGTLTAALNTGEHILTGCDDTPAADRQVAIASRSETLYCTPDGQTERPC
jgi:hypothetical protein